MNDLYLVCIVYGTLALGLTIGFAYLAGRDRSLGAFAFSLVSAAMLVMVAVLPVIAQPVAA